MSLIYFKSPFCLSLCILHNILPSKILIKTTCHLLNESCSSLTCGLHIFSKHVKLKFFLMETNIHLGLWWDHWFNFCLWPKQKNTLTSYFLLLEVLLPISNFPVVPVRRQQMIRTGVGIQCGMDKLLTLSSLCHMETSIKPAWVSVIPWRTWSSTRVWLKNFHDGVSPEGVMKMLWGLEQFCYGNRLRAGVVQTGKEEAP